jgi:hypothetical protein
MATLKELKAAARKMGATVVDGRDGRTHSCRVEAPAGYVWAGCDVHELTEWAYVPWKPDYDDLIERMGHGIKRCEDAHCEWCIEEEA